MIHYENRMNKAGRDLRAEKEKGPKPIKRPGTKPKPHRQGKGKR